MTIEQLQYFMAIAKFKNFSIAAEECFISQSSMSKQIKALEAELGAVELFDRNTKKLGITYAGKEFYIFAEKILAEYQKMMKTMKKHTGGHLEVINVGTIPVMDHYGLTDVFSDFQEYYSNIRLRVIEANSVPIIEEFTRRRIDIAFLRNNYLPVGDFKTYPLVDDELVLVTNYSNWLAKYDIIDLREAENEQFLFLGNNTGMSESCRQACIRAGFVPREEVWDVRSRTIKNLVATGQGVTLMMHQSIKFMDDPRIKIIRLNEPSNINLTMVVRKDTINDAVSTFIEYVIDSFGKM